MYKAKTKWMVAGVTMFSTMLSAGTLATIHADNVNLSTSSSSQLPITDLNSQAKNYQKQQNQSSTIKSSSVSSSLSKSRFNR